MTPMEKILHNRTSAILDRLRTLERDRIGLFERLLIMAGALGGILYLLDLFWPQP